MSSGQSFPVNILPKFEAYIDQMGKRQAFERILEHIPIHYAGVRSVSVWIKLDEVEGVEEAVQIEVRRNDPGYADGADWYWIHWLVENMRAEDFIHFRVHSVRVTSAEASNIRNAIDGGPPRRAAAIAAIRDRLP